ncbi:MAG: radical SAM protein, partial [Desulfobulbaceae bacterium]|nr:radical SAM protein [Desulfobulbaceae bacterium]
MNKILFFYEKCQLKCEYCHFEFNKDGFTGYNEQHNVGKHLSADQILDGLESLIPYHIEFTGGEPTLYKGFKDIVNGLPDSCTWAITSNTLTNITGLEFDKCAHWTASYHGFQMDKYKENIKYLVENNTPLSISVVIPFNDFDKYVAMAKDLKVLGCRVNILR